MLVKTNPRPETACMGVTVLESRDSGQIATYGRRESWVASTIAVTHVTSSSRHDRHLDEAYERPGGLRTRPPSLPPRRQVETYALVGGRLGLDAVRSFRVDFAPLIDVVWVDRELYDAGLDLMLDRRKRLLSLVDGLSFVAMRQADGGEAVVFDSHFAQ